MFNRILKPIHFFHQQFFMFLGDFSGFDYWTICKRQGRIKIRVRVRILKNILHLHNASKTVPLLFNIYLISFD